MTIPAVSSAANLDLTIQQGSDFAYVLTITSDGSTPVDLSSTTCAAKIRSDFGTSATVLATITATVTDAANGEITLSLTDTVTAALGVSASATDNSRTVQIGYWDLELTEATLVYRYVQGAVTISREATV